MSLKIYFNLDIRVTTSGIAMKHTAAEHIVKEIIANVREGESGFPHL